MEALVATTVYCILGSFFWSYLIHGDPIEQDFNQSPQLQLIAVILWLPLLIAALVANIIEHLKGG